jgi:hypothetical protein
MPRRKKRNLLPVITGFIIIIASVIIYLYLTMHTEFSDNQEDELSVNDSAIIAPRSIDDIEAGLSTIQRALQENRSSVVLPGHLAIPVVGEDINSDGQTETIAVEYHNRGSLHEDLIADGYQGPVLNLRIFGMRGSTVLTLLDISPQSITRSDGSRLIDQEEAQHGYAYRLSNYTGENYTGEVRLLELILLDSSGNVASDDITIYWKPSTGDFAATNTFGAPGTF